MRIVKLVAFVAALALGVIFALNMAFANATAPTNGGLGAGQSGQCTGNQADRPASCGP
jgi:hypothetical protein